MINEKLKEIFEDELIFLIKILVLKCDKYGKLVFVDFLDFKLIMILKEVF